MSLTLKELVKAAILEDMPQGDLTTDSLGFPPRPGRAKLMAKQDLTLSGAPVFEQTLITLDPQVKCRWHFEEGDEVLNQQNICTIQGDLVQILKAERVALNFLMHLSGIATLTRAFVNEVRDTDTRILDTRKTLPGYRDLEKKAVLHGGGVNHRANLSSALLLKDNHIRMAGGIREAIQRVRSYSKLPLIVEAETLDEVQSCIQMGVERILLDNMDNETISRALEQIPDGIETEASGNMTLQRVRSVALLGVDYISVGTLTHSAPSADVSLKFEWTLAK